MGLDFTGFMLEGACTHTESRAVFFGLEQALM